MKNFRYFVIITVLILSCTKSGIKTEDQSLSSISGKISFKNNMLVFNSTDDYIFMSDQLNKQALDAQVLKQMFPSFKSMEEAYWILINSKEFENLQSLEQLNQYKDFLRVRKENGDVYIEPLLDLEKPIFYNSEGFVQIGDEIIKRDLNQETILNTKFVDSYSDLKREFSTKTNLKVFPVNLVIQTTGSLVSNNNGVLEPRADCLDYWCDDASNPNCTWKYKFIGSTIFDNPSGATATSTSGARTRSYKKGVFGFALSRDGFYLEQSGTVTVTAQSKINPALITTTTFNINEHSSYTGSDHTIENLNQGCCLTFLSVSSNVTFTGTRWSSSGTAYPKSCHL
jgi:hypothetical protein